MTRLIQPAQYLLRVDDLCPTVHAERWRRVRELMGECGIQPILAVVPDNRDPGLQLSTPDPGFWESLRSLQAGGAAIALHGLHHVCSSRRAGILPLSASGEFAGLPYAVQQRRIRDGVALLRGHGLEPRLWVAPRHNFDRHTLRALREQGIFHLSDGLMRRPFQRGGVVWIPQQLWWPAQKRHGLWTLCIHPNSLSVQSFAGLRHFLRNNAGQFTCFQRVVREFTPSPPRWPELVRERAEILRLRLRSAVVRYVAPSASPAFDATADSDRLLPTDPGSS